MPRDSCLLCADLQVLGGWSLLFSFWLEDAGRADLVDALRMYACLEARFLRVMAVMDRLGIYRERSEQPAITAFRMVQLLGGLPAARSTPAYRSNLE